MQVVITEQGENREATCEFVQEPRPQWAEIWRKQLTGSISNKQEDSIEFLESALSKWHLYRVRGRIAGSEQDFNQQISDNPQVDVLAIITLDAPWFRLSGGMGMCQFRRTWQHNFVIDYIAVHPVLLGEVQSIEGVGTMLLYTVATLATTLKIEKVWLETTDLSAPYYSRLFGIAEASDLLVLPAQAFYESLHRRYTGVRTTN
jgi:hypothetical protein